MIKAEIIADSTNWTGNRLTTFVLTFPRYVLSELNTHRAFSRNSGSSRAIPFKKMVKMVQENPFIPIAWQKEHTGMQGTEYFESQEDIDNCYMSWKDSAEDAIERAKHLNELGVTKQLCNRLLEPFMWHTAIVTATDFENFFEQRSPVYYGSVESYRSKKDVESSLIAAGHDFQDFTHLTDLDWLKRNEGMGEIHIMALAEAMWDAYNESKPKYLIPGEWHLPYIGFPKIYDQQWLKSAIKTSVAKCARVSYGRENVETTVEEDIKMFDRLVGSKPLHASPSEHQGRVPTEDEHIRLISKRWRSNLRGWIQLRKLIETEEFI